MAAIAVFHLFDWSVAVPHPEPLVSTEQRHRSHTHPSAAAGATPPGIAMAFRHGLTVFLMLLFTLCAFALTPCVNQIRRPRHRRDDIL